MVADIFSLSDTLLGAKVHFTVNDGLNLYDETYP